jgi:hypothetical protein
LKLDLFRFPVLAAAACRASLSTLARNSETRIGHFDEVFLVLAMDLAHKSSFQQ